MKIVIQKEVHGALINNVGHATPLWRQGDGMITAEPNLGLVAYGADCAIIAFWNDTEIGVCHAGWRGYTQGIIKDMVHYFNHGSCFVGPFLHDFCIKKDEAYEKISAYTGSRFITESSEGVMFHFKQAIEHELQELKAVYDSRCTFDHVELGSWRRDQIVGNGTQNRLVIWRTEGEVYTKVFHPSESVSSYFAQEEFKAQRHLD